MAKRLSKALRGKRRWVGVACSPEFENRSSLQAHMEQLWNVFGIESKIRLMEFYPASSPEVERITATLDASQPLAYAVLQVPHPSFALLRTLIEGEDSMATHKLHSCTSSGKIRLVRERMGMPKPSRKR
jgi:hypothetical protein